MTGVTEVAAFADEHVVGVELADLLAAVDPGPLDDHDVLESVAAWDRVIAWASARQLAALAELARRPARVQVVGEDLEAVRADYAPVGRWVREFADDEVAARLRISRLAASSRISLATDLQRLPSTRSALTAGRIDLARARVLAEETKALDGDTARTVESALIGRAGRVGVAALRQAVRRAAIAADPIAAQHRAACARSDRRVVVTPAADGMADLWAHLPAAEARAIDLALSAAARGSTTAAVPGDDRTMDQRRADALAEPFLAALASGSLRGPGDVERPLARRRGQVTELQVTVAASTLLGLDDDPAHLHGYGPITAETARGLAPDARWRRILTDPVSGALLDVGTTTYRPPADLQRFVETRSPRCTFPGCRWPAAASDLDHTVPFPEGRTSAANLGPRCRRHHRLKQAAGYSVTQDADGTSHWQMPTGHHYDVPPPALAPPAESRAAGDADPTRDAAWTRDADRTPGAAPPSIGAPDCSDGPDPPRMES